MWLCTIVIAIATYLAMKLAGRLYGPDVGRRFLETNSDYLAEGLRDWVLKYPRSARQYIFPVLFPLDLLFASSLGAVFMICSITLTLEDGRPGGRIWPLVLVPGLYVTLNFVKDLMLSRVLRSAASVTEEMVSATKSIMRLKTVVLGLSVIQICALSIMFICY
jgi:hypothetical protein